MKSFFAVFCLFLSANICFAQSKVEPIDYLQGGGIPLELQASLNNRLEQFIKAFQDERWEVINELLGNFRGSSGGKQYTIKNKQCLIDSIRSSPISSFTPTKTSFSSAIVTRPLNQKWWLIRGNGEFKKESGYTSKEITIVAYRDKSNWFFFPALYVDRWNYEKAAQTAEADFVKYVEVLQSSASGLEIQNVAVKIHPTAPAKDLRRLLKFDVYNNSAKTVGYVHYQFLGNGGFPISVKKEIKPQEKVTFETEIGPGVDFCEGERTGKLFIDEVHFTDKTKWNSKS